MRITQKHAKRKHKDEIFYHLGDANVGIRVLQHVMNCQQNIHVHLAIYVFVNFISGCQGCQIN